MQTATPGAVGNLYPLCYQNMRSACLIATAIERKRERGVLVYLTEHPAMTTIIAISATVSISVVSCCILLYQTLQRLIDLKGKCIKDAKRNIPLRRMNCEFAACAHFIARYVILSTL